MTVDVLGDTFDHYGFSPRMISDWRWYKSLYGENRNFNARFLDSFYSTAHNLLDYRDQSDLQDSSLNQQLEVACFDFLKQVMAFEFENAGIDSVLSAIDTLRPMLEIVSPDMERALVETQTLITRPSLSPADVCTMKHLTPLFGREMMYASYTRES